MLWTYFFAIARWRENSDFYWRFSKEKLDFVKDTTENDYFFLILLLHCDDKIHETQPQI